MKTSEMFPQKERSLPSFEDVKGHTSIVRLVGRNVVLKKNAGKHVGLCPFHNEKTPSFTVNETKRFFHCFGCGAHGDAFDYLRLAQGMGLHEALEHLAIEAGMVSDHEGRKRPTRQPIAPQAVRDDQDERNRIDFARRKWCEAVALTDSPADVYLRARGLRPGSDGWPPSLRSHPALKHGPTGLLLPALIAAITIWPGRNVVGVHRTFLRMDGRDKAPVSNNKMMLGKCAGGAVRLAPAASELLVCEGIETALGVQQGTGKPVWACLSTGGMKTVILPPEVETVIIAADGDEPGEEAAQEAARRFIAEGRTAKIARPPKGMDFNDMLQLPGNVAVISDNRRRMKANG